MWPKCDKCGRWTKGAPGASWAAIYSSYELSHELMRCVACTEKFGPVESNASPADGDMRPYEGTYQ